MVAKNRLVMSHFEANAITCALHVCSFTGQCTIKALLGRS